MEHIRDVTLKFTAGDNGATRKAIVSFTLSFAETEAGRPCRYDVKLRAQDLPEAGGVMLADKKLLCDFSFNHDPSQTFAAQPGEKVVTETRVVPVSVLNEDPLEWTKVIPGHKGPSWSPTQYVTVHDLDEIYAEVSLAMSFDALGGLTTNETARSKTVVLDL